MATGGHGLLGTWALMVGLQHQHGAACGSCGQREGPRAPARPAPVGPTSSFMPSESSIMTQASMGRAMSRPRSCRWVPSDTPYTLKKGVAVIEGEGSAGTRQISGPGSSHSWQPGQGSQGAPRHPRGLLLCPMVPPPTQSSMPHTLKSSNISPESTHLHRFHPSPGHRPLPSAS